MEKNPIIEALDNAYEIVQNEQKTYRRIAESFRMRGDEQEAIAYEWKADDLDNTLVGIKSAIAMIERRK